MSGATSGISLPHLAPLMRATYCRMFARTGHSLSRPNKFPNDFKAGRLFLFGFRESCFFFAEVVLLSRPVPSRPRGVRVVTNVGRDAMDADACAGRAARSADGEVVWSWHPWAGAKPAGRRPAGDGDYEVTDTGESTKQR
jgi:hypothetical protein